MTEELNPLTLDLVGVLSGRDYPTLDIEVYFNEALGFSIYQLQKLLASAEARKSEEADELYLKVQDLVKESSTQKYTITLQAIPEGVRADLIQQVQEAFPEKVDFAGRVQTNPKGDAEYVRVLWGAYLAKITGPDGASKVVDEADVKLLLREAPKLVHEQINSAINELQNGSKAGFEFAAREIDFLSLASPEG